MFNVYKLYTKWKGEDGGKPFLGCDAEYQSRYNVISGLYYDDISVFSFVLISYMYVKVIETIKVSEFF